MDREALKSYPTPSNEEGRNESLRSYRITGLPMTLYKLNHNKY